MYFVSGPFIDVLKPSGPASDERVTAVLRLLRERVEQVPELKAICRRLVQSKNSEIRGLAHEILVRLGVAPKARAETGGVQVDDPTGITFVTIPGGEHQMGSNAGFFDDEKPVHGLQIARAFLLGKYPVTNAQYRRFVEVAEASVQKPKYWDDRRFNQPEQPVVGVSWDDAQAFCQWAEGRLPTEAEWEYACRAATTTEYSYGDNEKKLIEYGWFSGNSGSQTQPVGTKKPNPWALYDMHGNVLEWCEDQWHDDHEGAPSDGSAWVGKGSNRVYRGGSWASPAGNCRSAYRNWRTPSYRGSYLGFRVARSFAGRVDARRTKPAAFPSR